MPAVNSGTLAMVFLLGRSQGRRQLLGCVKSCGLTLWEFSKSQLYPAYKHSGGAGSGTKAVSPSFLPFRAVSGLLQMTGLGLAARGAGRGLCPQAALGRGGHGASSAHAGRGEGRRGALLGIPQLMALAFHQRWSNQGTAKGFGGATWGVFPTEATSAAPISHQPIPVH